MSSPGTEYSITASERQRSSEFDMRGIDAEDNSLQITRQAVAKKKIVSDLVFLSSRPFSFHHTFPLLSVCAQIVGPNDGNQSPAIGSAARLCFVEPQWHFDARRHFDSTFVYCAPYRLAVSPPTSRPGPSVSDRGRRAEAVAASLSDRAVARPCSVCDPGTESRPGAWAWLVGPVNRLFPSSWQHLIFFSPLKTNPGL